ncbi:hypothetical protein HYG81_09205 [Natrinema zhouii]|uniref:Uncharacterized protein n=1 Tax=Natrinema zhouii TaxID=1710539 RepID=A0A7D6CQT2_9EURY|nr:hypothetical protein [Natrinema zhouii]QLK27757.1 hypothetical protein HYG81_09205 [Natrinema zhouii]
MSSVRHSLREVWSVATDYESTRLWVLVVVSAVILSLAFSLLVTAVWELFFDPSSTLAGGSRFLSMVALYLGFSYAVNRRYSIT